MPRRWYQTIEIDGVNTVFEDVNRKKSSFWNEGKWHNFIEPLLPKERQTFLEIGCNAGLFLKMATDAGFKRVIGVDGSKSIMKQAEAFKESNGYEYKLINQAVGGGLMLEELPLLDVVLISNSHYYMMVDSFIRLIDTLKHRALYCLIVSARAKRRQGRATHEMPAVRGYLQEWTEIKVVNGIEIDNDPSPRPDMYGMLYKSDMVAHEIDSYYGAWQEAAKNPRHRSHRLAPVMEEYFERIVSGEEFDLTDSSFYKYWRERRAFKSEQSLLDYAEYKKQLALDIQANGMKEPIYIRRDSKLLDGIHRLCIAKVLGYDHIISRII